MSFTSTQLQNRKKTIVPGLIKTLFVLLLQFFFMEGFAQPSNDDPCNAIPLNTDNICNYQAFTNANATASTGVPAPGCASYSGGDVWFTLVVPCNGAFTIDTQTGVMTDGGMAIYSGDCSNLTLIACDDDGSANGLMPRISRTGLIPGTTIFIRMWEYGNNNNGTFSICVSIPPPPGPGSVCNNALPFCSSNVYTFPNTTGIPNSGGGGIYGCLSTIPNPVWYYMQVQNTGPITMQISQTSTSGAGIDVDFVIWGPFPDLPSSCGNLSSTNIVDCSYLPDPIETAEIPNAQAGQFYIIMITNYSGQPGNITFQQTAGTGSTNCSIVCNLTATNTGPVCPGGSFNLGVNAVSNAVYSWTGPNCFTSNTQNPTGIIAPTMPGTYVYTVTATVPGGGQCLSSTTVTVTGVTASTNVINASCPGSSDGSITLNPTPGGAYTYVLTPGNISQSNPTFTGLNAGTYSVAISSGGGCNTTVNNIVITAGNLAAGTYTATNATCPGVNDGTITITPTGAGPYSFTLNPGNITQANPTFSGLAPGTYSVNFTIGTGCQGILNNIVILSGPAPTGTASATNTNCPGVNDGTITVTPGGAGPYTFTLNPGNITQLNPTFTGLAAGTYTISFTNGAGCTGSVSSPVVISQGPALTGTANSTPTSCPTVNDGTITVSPGGTGPYTFTLNPGNISQSNPTFTGLAAGTYNISFVTASGCTGTVPVNPTVTQGPYLSSTVTPYNPPCANINDGSITINPGGTGPYSFTLNPGNITQTSPTFIGLAPGTYTYSFTDGIGCTGTGSITLTTNTPLALNVSKTMPLCYGNSNGSITLIASGGVATYQYALSPFSTYQSSGTFNGLAAGTYTLRVRDNVGCTKDTTVTLAEPTLLNASAANTTTAGCSNNDGSITATGNGGTIPYTFSITGPVQQNTTGINTGIFTGLAAGNYTAIVTDTKGCIANAAVTVALVDNMFMTLGADTTICVESSVTFQPQTNPETSVFQWRSPDANINTLDNPSIKNAKATPKDTSIYILNAQWGTCVREDTIIVNILHKPVPNAGADTAICFKTHAFLRGSVSNTSGPVLYSWSPATYIDNPDTTTTTVRPPTAGFHNYTLSIQDDYGCNFSVTDLVRITVQPPVPAYAGHDTIAVSGVPHQLWGSGGNQYIWSPAAPLNNPFAATPLATLSNDTKFTLIVTDVAGCIGWDTVFIKVYNGPTYYIPNAFTPNGDGMNDVFRAVPVGIVRTDWFRIFNRYGEKVFETNQWLKGWDGSYRGKQQPMGVYIWIIKGTDRNGKVVEMKGTVTLVH